MDGFFTTNTMLWAAQIALACVLFYAAFTKVVPGRVASVAGANSLMFACDGMPCTVAYFLAVLEFVGAVCLIVPIEIWPAHLLARIAASLLAVLILITCIHHVKHKQHTAPLIAAFFLAVFIVVGRWP